MNTTAAKWLSMDLDQKLQWLEYTVWENQKNWKTRKTHSLAGEQALIKTHTDSITNQEGLNNMDRFKLKETASAGCECEYCGNELEYGMDAVKTDDGLFCGFTCYGRFVAEEQGFRKAPLSADMVG